MERFERPLVRNEPKLPCDRRLHVQIDAGDKQDAAGSHGGGEVTQTLPGGLRLHMAEDFVGEHEVVEPSPLGESRRARVENRKSDRPPPALAYDEGAVACRLEERVAFFRGKTFDLTA